MTIIREERIGDCRLILGDCLDVMPTLEPVDAVVTDPPYGVNFIGKKNSYKQTRDGVGYSSTVDADVAVAVRAVSYCVDALGRVVVTPGTRNVFSYPTPDDMGSVYFPAGAGYGRWGFTCAQPILYYGACPYNANRMGARANSVACSEPAEKNGHPCPKPIGLTKWLVTRASLDGETILDPFMGSGTTLVACAKLGRAGIGIELDPDYFDIACRRVEEAYRQPDFFTSAPAPQPKQEAFDV